MSRQALIEQALKTARPSSTGWWRANCPVCLTRTGKADYKQALAINKSIGAYACWKCQVSGRLKNYVPDHTWVPEAPTLPVSFEPPGFVELTQDLTSFSFQAARNYALKRCPRDLWETTRIGACASGPYAGRVVVPIFAEDDETWLGWVGRTWLPTERAYTYPKGMNRGDVLYRSKILTFHTDEPVVVVEGVFDAIHMWPNGVALLGKASENQMEALLACPRPVVIVLDGDAWQEADAMVMRLKLHGKHAGYVRLPPKLDPDEVDREWLNDEIARSI